jgi:hypothetical protein
MHQPRRGGSKRMHLGADVSTFVCDVKINKINYALMVLANALPRAALHAIG